MAQQGSPGERAGPQPGWRAQGARVNSSARRQNVKTSVKTSVKRSVKRSVKSAWHRPQHRCEPRVGAGGVAVATQPGRGAAPLSRKTNRFTKEKISSIRSGVNQRGEARVGTPASSLFAKPPLRAASVAVATACPVATGMNKPGPEASKAVLPGSCSSSCPGPCVCMPWYTAPWASAVPCTCACACAQAASLCELARSAMHAPLRRLLLQELQQYVAWLSCYWTHIRGRDSCS
mmetsp:Transcript_26817/g.79633  ORF Transcript_26817/g.79633 Transcript_26817/m.79633 type:complete len:233 (-) Transcript_26817:7-705(-)